MPVRGDGLPFYYAQKNAWYVWFQGKRVSLKVRGKGRRKEAMEALGRLGTADIPIPHGNPRLPVPESVEAYLRDAERRRLKPNSLRTLRRFLIPFAKTYGHCRSDMLTASSLEAFLKPTWSTATRHTAMGTLVSFCRWVGHPVKVKIPPMVSRGRKAVISEADAQKVIAHARGDMQAVLRFLWLSGCRPSEALSLTASAFDEAKGLCLLENHKTDANGKPRIIYLTPEAVTLLAEQRAKYQTGLLFRTGSGKRITLNNAVNRLWRSNQRLGTTVTLYGFRHTLATDALANGIPEAHVAEMLGHFSTKMLSAHYSHLSARAKAIRDSAMKVRG